MLSRVVDPQHGLHWELRKAVESLSYLISVHFNTVPMRSISTVKFKRHFLKLMGSASVS